MLTGVIVLRASISFFVLGIISMFLGINSIAGLSIDIGKILLVVFLVLSIISFVLGRKGSASKLLSFALLAVLGSMSLQADDSVSETAKEAANDTERGTKNAVREMKDETCHLVKGKMECAVQKAKHTIQKGADNVEDAID